MELKIFSVIPFLITLLILCLLISEHSAMLLGASKHDAYETPQILLKSYSPLDSYRQKLLDKRFSTKNQFQNNFLSKNGTDFVISDETLWVEFACEAYYPITWTFPYPKQIHKVIQYDMYSKEFRTSKIDLHNHEPISQKFISVLMIATGYLNFLSVNLTCSSVENKPELHSSIYIFLNNRDIMEHEGQTFNIFAKPSVIYFAGDMYNTLPPIILPCRPASPDMIATLEKQINTTFLSDDGKQTDKKSWRNWGIFSQHTTFDPKVGFTMKRDAVGDWVFGMYRCSFALNSDTFDVNEVETSSGPYVYFNITRTKNDSLISDVQNWNGIFHSKSVIYGSASFHVNRTVPEKKYPDYRQTTFTCCTGTGNKAPSLYLEYCVDPLSCNILESFISQDIITEEKMKENKNYFNDGLNNNNVNGSADCSKDILHYGGAVIVCKGNNVDYMDHLIDCFHPQAGGLVENRSDRIIHDKNYKNYLNMDGDNSKTDHQLTSLLTYEPASALEHMDIVQKLIILVGRKVEKLKKHFGPTIFIPADNIQDYYADSYDDDDDYVEKRKYDRFLEYSRDVYYQEESLTFMCFGLQSTYAVGAKLALNWENGTSTFLEPNPTTEIRRTRRSTYNKLHLSGDVDDGFPEVFSFFGKNLTATKEMSSVDCWMPKLGSSKWDKVTKKIQVLPSTPPEFVESVDETVYFYLGDTGKSVNCTVIEGVPLSRVMVKRNGQRLNVSWAWNRSGNETLFPTVGANVTGDFDDSKRVLSLSIFFAPISHDHQAEFLCWARNINSTVKRVIRILVIDKPSVAMPIFLSFFAILLFVLAGLGIRHWYYKRYVSSLQSVNR